MRVFEASLDVGRGEGIRDCEVRDEALKFRISCKGSVIQVEGEILPFAFCDCVSGLDFGGDSGALRDVDGDGFDAGIVSVLGGASFLLVADSIGVDLKGLGVGECFFAGVTAEVGYWELILGSGDRKSGV